MKRHLTVVGLAVLAMSLLAGTVWAGSVSDRSDESIRGDWTFWNEVDLRGEVKVHDEVQTSGGEAILRGQPINFYDDFLVQADDIDGNSTAPWNSKLSTNGTVEYNATAPAFVRLDLTSVHGAEQALLYWGDKRTLYANGSLVFEARVRFDNVPNGTAEAQFGLSVDYATGTESPGYQLMFDLDGSGAVGMRAWNSSALRNVTSGVTVAADAWHVFRIDCSDVDHVRFYIDGDEIASTTATPFITAGAYSRLQPYFYANKTTTGTARLDVDYVRLWMSR